MSTTQPLHFTDTESEQLVVYRPVNRWAVAAVVFGILSALAILHPVFMVLPLAGLGVAVVAARQLASSEVAQSGGGAMKWGIFLCLMFGVCAATHIGYRQYRVQTAARRCGEQFLELVRDGKLYEAHQLTLHEQQRATAGTDLKKYYEPREQEAPSHGHSHSHRHDDPSAADPADMIDLMEGTPDQQLHRFLRSPAMSLLEKLGKQAEFTFVETVAQAQVSPVEIDVIERFGISYEEDGRTKKFTLRLTLERLQPEGVGIWRVVSVDLDSQS